MLILILFFTERVERLRIFHARTRIMTMQYNYVWFLIWRRVRRSTGSFPQTRKCRFVRQPREFPPKLMAHALVPSVTTPSSFEHLSFSLRTTTNALRWGQSTYPKKPWYRLEKRKYASLMRQDGN